MNYLSLDAIVVYTFLLVTLIVGLWAGRNIKSIEDYAIANRSYSTPTLILTFLATWVGGNFVLGYTAQTFEDGIIRILTAFSQIVSILFIAWVIAPRMQRFTNSITVGDLMGTFYGPQGKLITAIASLGYTIGLVGMQIVSLSYIYEWLGLQNKTGMVLASLVLIIYSAVGGIRAITTTDVFQFVVLIIVLPLLANVVTKEAGGIKEVFHQIPAEKLVIWQHKKLGYYWMNFILAILPVGLLSPPFIQRLLMAKNKQQAQDMYIAAGFFIILPLTIILLIAFSAFILYPNIKPTEIIPHIINQLVPVGLKGLCISGILAIIMSTADSFLGSGSLVVAHDMIKPICDKKGWANNEVKIVRYTTIAIGILSIGAAFISPSIVNLGFYAVTILGTIITIPLIAGILDLKADTKTFLTACLITLISLVTSHLILSPSKSYLVFPIAIGTNLVSFLLTHYTRHKKPTTNKKSYPTSYNA